MTILTCILFQLFSVVNVEDKPMVTFNLANYPKKVSFGDSIYLKIFATNHHANTIFIPSDYNVEFGDLRFSLENPENRLVFPLLIQGGWVERGRMLDYSPLKSDEKLEIGCVSFTIPALEDMNDPFWRKLLESGDKIEEYELILKVIINTKNAVNDRGDSEVQETVTLETPITLKLRSNKEMELMKKWHDDTPPDFFPTVNGARKSLPPRKVLFNKVDQVKHNGHTYKYEGFTTEYPGTPNWPETLDQWKKLEDAFALGTLRDELRLKRIIYEYDETKDSKVLKELKLWFKEMNEIQRSVLVQRIKNQVGSTKIDKHLYETIKEYDLQK